MKQMSRIKNREYKIFRMYGVVKVTKGFDLGRSFAGGLPDNPHHYLVSYYYCVGRGSVGMVRTQMSAVDEMEAFTKVMAHLRNKNITTEKQRRRKHIKAFKRLKKHSKGLDDWASLLKGWAAAHGEHELLVG